MKKPDLSSLTDEQKSKLSRDYEKEPLKYGEKPCKEDLYYLYITLNLRLEEVYKCLGRNPTILIKYLNEYGIKKPKALFKKQRIETCLQKWGVPHHNLAPEIKEKSQQTNMERYGVPFGAQSQQSKDKYKQTCLERYGVESVNQVESKKKKIEQTCLEKYGSKSPLGSKDIQAKIKQTCLEKYGVESFMESDMFSEKSKQTLLEKYGVDNVMRLPEIREKAKQTNLEKYGVANVFQSEEIQEKIKETFKEKYGSEHFCTSEYYDKDAVIAKRTETNMERYGTAHPIRLEEFEEKRKKTCQEKYGVNNVIQSEGVQKKRSAHIEEIVQKVYNTKKENNSFGKSDEEDAVYEILKTKFKVEDIDRQHDTEEYPFPCDFYIFSLGLYIEYQGYWSHGDDPYDETNKEHVEEVELWKVRSEDLSLPKKRRDLYRNAIKTRTYKDPLKRETAHKNNLNWIEFFNMEQFMEWFNSLPS